MRKRIKVAGILMVNIKDKLVFVIVLSKTILLWGKEIITSFPQLTTIYSTVDKSDPNALNAFVDRNTPQFALSITFQ